MSLFQVGIGRAELVHVVYSIQNRFLVGGVGGVVGVLDGWMDQSGGPGKLKAESKWLLFQLLLLKERHIVTI